MKFFKRVTGVLLLLCLLLTVNRGLASAQQNTSHYFPLTGHNVSGEFWIYYQTVYNASFLIGDPITEQFSDPISGRVVQYFQRARFEYYPENPAGQRVKLTDIGLLVHQKAPTGGAVNPFTPLACRNYVETGFSLCYSFLNFYDANGGEPVFGKPISYSVPYINGRIVQYFERARFDWYPDFPEGQKVKLAELGRIYFDIVPEDPNRLQPARSENSPSDVRSINARVFTWKAVTQLTDQQEIYVVVRDQIFNPVSGATAVVTINWSQGGSQSIAQTTNDYGFVKVPIHVQGQPHDSLVVIDVEVLYNGLTSKTSTSFRVWK